MSKKLAKSTSLVGGMTLLSRLLGFIRDVIFAEVFGATAGFDAFIIAFKLPNFMRRLFGEGAFSQAFVPVLAEYKEQRPHEDVKEFVNRIAGCLGMALFLVVIVAEIAAPGIITIFAPGFIEHPDKFFLASHLLRWTFPYLLFIALTAFCGAILNTFSKFAVPAFTPVLLNLTFIVVALWWAPHTASPIMTLAWGVLIAGVLQLLLQLPFLARQKVLPIPKWGWNDPGVIKVLKLMLPALFGVSVAQIGLLTDNFFASFLPTGSISWLYYSDRFTYLPLGVIGVALSTVVLPYLSKQYASRSNQAYSHTLNWALRCALVIGVPAAVGLITLAGPILATLVHHGAFDDYDVRMTQQSLIAFAFGLPGFMLVKVLASGFYSRQNIKTPVRIAALCVVVNIVLNIALIKPFAHAGLALATSISSLLNAGLLWRGLVKQHFFTVQSGWLKMSLRMLVAIVVMAALVLWLAGDLEQWLVMGLWDRIWRLVVYIIAGFVAYFAVLYVLGMRLKDFSAPEKQVEPQ
ncbi:MAG: murein biosynthesis integral membrane protein MurJ [Coxiellaceae bacterium]|nr:murein biosynthesis integral membrane protein MurJ [Coxiellaceae bacterium]